MKPFTGILILLFLCGINTTFAQSLDDQVEDSLKYVIPVEIRSSRSYEGRNVSLSRNHFLSFPAAFDDPSRLLLKYPGFATQNDQSNFIIYRGMPPQFSSWTINGGLIINPNHLSNAGTISDRSSRSAGGINAFSGQIIGRFEYNSNPTFKSIYPSLAGISNVGIRQSSQHKTSVNLGLLGLEVGLDRKFGENSNQSLLFNGRYSTLGALTALGVDLGDEEIAFQDLFFSYKIKQKENLDWSFYGLYGTSSNKHKPLSEAEVMVLKDLLNIEFENKLAIFGASMSFEAEYLNVRSTLNYSFRDSKRTQLRPDSLFKDLSKFEASSDQFESITSLLLDAEYQLNSFKLLGGLHAAYFNETTLIIDEGLSDGESSYFQLHPFVGIHKMFGQLSVMSKATSSYDGLSKSFNILPKVMFSFKPDDLTWQFELNYSQTDQLPSYELIHARSKSSGESLNNENFSRYRANHVQLGIGHQTLNLGLAGFYHKLSHLAHTNNGSYFVDAGNMDELPVEFLSYSGNMKHFGIEAWGFHPIFDNGTVSWNGSLFNANTRSRGNESSSAYDFGHIVNIQVGQKIHFSENKFLGLSLSAHHRGGGYQHQIDKALSRSTGNTVYESTIPFATRHSSYFRSDARIYYMKKKPFPSAYKFVVSLDIQNISNKENDAYFYFDPVTDKIQLEKQLGIIPVLSFRIEW